MLAMCAVLVVVSMAVPIHAEDGGAVAAASGSAPAASGSDPQTPASGETPKPAPETPPPPSPVTNKWAASMYGFAELDSIYDSTQGFNDLAGNAAIGRPGTFAGDNDQLTFSVRNSRIGFKLASPEYHGIRASAILEMDFLGNQPPNASESAFFTNATFRIRHMAVKLEDRYVDVLAGQYWQLFGWQPYFQPNTVQNQGVAGEVYGRAPQLRFSHLFYKGQDDPVSLEIAAAASRPPQRASGTPDGQGAVRVLFNKWRGLRTVGATGTAVDAMAVGISGVTRRFAVAEFSATPVNEVKESGWGESFDVLIPIIAATNGKRANALTLTGSYVRGAAIADLYTGLTGGVSFPTLPGGGAYTPNVDNGLVMFDANGGLHPVDWKSQFYGLQYYLPGSGKIWFAVNYSHMSSDNADQFGAANKVFTDSTFKDANVSWDLTPAVRLGVEATLYQQTYADGVDAKNHRYLFSMFYMF
jgi:hypothetical protein